MKSFVVIDTDIRESEKLKSEILNLAAHLTDEQWNVLLCGDLKEVSALVEKETFIDFCCMDVSVPGILSMIPNMREINEKVSLMIIADETVSPLVYLKPGVKPDSLMVRPTENYTMRTTLEEFMKAYLDRSDTDNENAFVVETKEGKTFLPYNSIYYFEAREKKIFAKTMHEEYGFYSTMDELEQILPETFTRCHRSYIVNSKKINRMISAQNMLELEKKLVVPISRTYKSSIRTL